MAIINMLLWFKQTGGLSDHSNHCMIIDHTVIEAWLKE